MTAENARRLIVRSVVSMRINRRRAGLEPDPWRHRGLCDRLADPQNADALARITLDTALLGLRAGSGITNDLSFECIYTADTEERQS